MTKEEDLYFMNEGIKEAALSAQQGGIPIGSVLVIDKKIVGRGHNQRIQQGDPVLHGEMDCLKNAGRLSASDYAKATIYSTLSPCDMCTGAILLYKIPRVVFAENETFKGGEDYMRSRGIEVINLDLDEAKQLMNDFINQNPDCWNEDIGELTESVLS